MRGRVAKLLRKSCKFIPSAEREYKEQNHISHFPITFTNDNGIEETKMMPRKRVQLRCLGERLTYLQMKRAYKHIRQGRYKNESQYLTEREESHVRGKEVELEDSNSDGSKEEAKSNPDRATNETRNQETQGETCS